MHCPSCKELMTNRDERHHVDPDSYRMNLHCNAFVYDDYGKLKWKSSNCYTCHMGVIVVPNGQEWICDHYNFKFNRFGRSFILRATPSTPNIEYRDGKFHLVYGAWKYTEVLSDYYSPPIIQVPFIPLSTGDDMHLHAEEVFKKLTKLILFS